MFRFYVCVTCFLSFSMESLDKIGEREQFLTKNFESLDVGDESLEGSVDSPHGKNRSVPQLLSMLHRVCDGTVSIIQ